MNRSSLEDGGWRILRCLIRSPSQTSGQPPMEAANNRPGLIGGGVGFEPTSDFRRIDLIAWQEDRRRPVLQ